jgi:hypothetical protein
MVALLERTQAVVRSAAAPTVILAIPAGAWLALTNLAQAAGTDRSTRWHLRRAVGSVTEIDSVLHVAVMVRSGEVQGLSAHAHGSGAELALVGWLREQPELWPGLTLEDWQHLLEAGLAPEELVGSAIVMLPIDLTRPGEERHDR